MGLKDTFIYKPESGDICWKESRKGVMSENLTAGGISVGKWTSYRIITCDGYRYKAHRLAWYLYYGIWPTGVIDHINGDGLDNRICNLRDVELSDNNKNIRKSKKNTSGVIGVSWIRSRQLWQASIQVNGKSINLGLFRTKYAAAYARHAASIKYGFHKNHGRSGKP